MLIGHGSVYTPHTLLLFKGILYYLGVTYVSHLLQSVSNGVKLPKIIGIKFPTLKVEK